MTNSKDKEANNLKISSRIVTTHHNADVIEPTGRPSSSKQTLLGSLIAGAIIITVLIAVMGYLKQEPINRLDRSTPEKQDSIAKDPEKKEGYSEYQIDFDIKVVDPSVKEDLMLYFKLDDFSKISKSQHNELCVVIHARELRQHETVEYQIQLLDIKETMLIEHRDSYRAPTSVWALLAWCGLETAELPVGLYLLNVNLAGNEKVKRIRLVD